MFVFQCTLFNKPESPDDFERINNQLEHIKQQINDESFYNERNIPFQWTLHKGKLTDKTEI